MNMSVRRWRSRLAELLSSGPVDDADDSLRARLNTIRWLAPRGRILALSASSVAGALCEAVVLMVVIRSAAALATDEQMVKLSLGPLTVEEVSITRLLLAAACLAVLRLLIHLATSYLAAGASSSVLLRLRVDLVRAFLKSSWDTQSSQRTGFLQDLATTHATEAARATVFLALAITAAVNFTTMVASAILVSPVSALVMGMGVFVLYFVFRPLTRVTRAKAKQFAAANGDYAMAVSEGSSLALESSTFGTGPAVGAALGHKASISSRRFFELQALARSLSGLYQNIAILALVAGMWAVSRQADAELATLGGVVLILLRALSYSQSFQVAQHNVNELVPFAERARAQIGVYKADRRTSGTEALPTIETLQFEAVGFCYEAGHNVLVEVGFRALAGEAIGVVGPSGAGKSTLAQILLRLRLPSTGRYLVNGRSVEEFSLDQWCARVSFVPQEPHMMSGTVRDNVRFYRAISTADIEAACRSANIHDEILGWSDGYDTDLGSGANPLSGGQRQRICIARALAGQPDVLVLDEPTSALDMRSESAIQQTLETLRGRVTLVIIAHRVSTLRLCDRVMVFDAGRLQAFATPAELAKTNAFFSEALRLSRV